MQKEDVLLKCLPVRYHETHQTLNHIVSNVSYLQCGIIEAYEHALVSPLRGISHPIKRSLVIC